MRCYRNVNDFIDRLATMGGKPTELELRPWW
jgi:hypothetical protein